MGRLGVAASCPQSSVNDDGKDNGGRKIAEFLLCSEGREVNTDGKRWEEIAEIIFLTNPVVSQKTHCH